MNDVKEALEVFKSKTGQTPKVGLVLGSGLGELADEIEKPDYIPYHDLPHFPEPTVAGHKGRFVLGKLKGQSVIAMQGRYHHYEGYTLRQVAFPVAVMKAAGINTLIVTNAAGGINLNFTPGDLMLIRDHINLLGGSPLIGPNDDEMGPRFPDMSAAYTPSLIERAEREAERAGVRVQEGVYLATPGPQYETPAEIRMMRSLGADAVGMSTVPEVIAASHAGLSVLGISCITNMASGILDQPLSHHEVIETAERVKENFTRLVEGVVEHI